MTDAIQTIRKLVKKHNAEVKEKGRQQFAADTAAPLRSSDKPKTINKHHVELLRKKRKHKWMAHRDEVSESADEKSETEKAIDKVNKKVSKNPKDGRVEIAKKEKTKGKEEESDQGCELDETRNRYGGKLGDHNYLKTDTPMSRSQRKIIHAIGKDDEQKNSYGDYPDKKRTLSQRVKRVVRALGRKIGAVKHKSGLTKQQRLDRLSHSTDRLVGKITRTSNRDSDKASELNAQAYKAENEKKATRRKVTNALSARTKAERKQKRESGGKQGEMFGSEHDQKVYDAQVAHERAKDNARDSFGKKLKASDLKLSSSNARRHRKKVMDRNREAHKGSKTRNFGARRSIFSHAEIEQRDREDLQEMVQLVKEESLKQWKARVAKLKGAERAAAIKEGPPKQKKTGPKKASEQQTTPPPIEQKTAEEKGKDRVARTKNVHMAVLKNLPSHVHSTHGAMLTNLISKGDKTTLDHMKNERWQELAQHVHSRVQAANKRSSISLPKITGI